MNAEEVIECHPLRLLEGKKAIPKGELSLMLARSGVGKSAALINFALEEIMQGKQVYHFNAGMPSEKTHQYYQKIFGDYSRINHPHREATWEDVYHHFTVISYLDPDKMVSDLDAETDTILSGTELEPSLLIVDGLDFGRGMEDNLATMAEVAKKHDVKLLASIRIHRKDEGNEIDLAGPLDAAEPYSAHIYFLEPDPSKDRINLEFVTREGNELLPVYFCPHDFIFRVS